MILNSITTMRGVVILSCILGTVISQSAPCPHGWLNRGPSCYAFITGAPDGWTEAEFYCNLMHSQLVEIETVVEEEFLRMHLLDNKLTGNFWIGMTDTLVEGEWVWMSTQTVARYTNWGPGEPSNGGGHEDCAAIASAYSFRWNDAPCSTKYNFICEKESHGEESVIG